MSGLDPCDRLSLAPVSRARWDMCDLPYLQGNPRWVFSAISWLLRLRTGGSRMPSFARGLRARCFLPRGNYLVSAGQLSMTE